MYKVRFPYTADPNYPEGKDKYALVLQAGPYFANYQTVTVVLLTSKVPATPYPTDVLVPTGTLAYLTAQDSMITCGQAHTVPKPLFEGAEYAGHLPAEYMAKVDEALAIGLGIVDVLTGS
ncbi:MAG: type II toxin-antitoxin system PemK/MazF family toxin [bacterium]|nr:type II toxin-antitoxin system PemK/MazF family toxin [bacterium]